MSITFKTNFASDAQIATMFGTVGAFERHKVGDRVVTAGSTVVLKRAKELAPRDIKNNAKKRSENQKNSVSKSGVKINWDIQLRTTMALKVVKTDMGAYAIVGPKYPDGNKAYFNTGPSGNKGHHWGYPGKEYPTKRVKADGTPVVHKAGQAKARIQIRNWIVQAADETKSEQVNAMGAKLKEAIDEVMRG